MKKLQLVMTERVLTRVVGCCYREVSLRLMAVGLSGQTCVKACGKAGHHRCGAPLASCYQMVNAADRADPSIIHVILAECAPLGSDFRVPVCGPDGTGGACGRPKHRIEHCILVAGME